LENNFLKKMIYVLTIAALKEIEKNKIVLSQKNSKEKHKKGGEMRS